MSHASLVCNLDLYHYPLCHYRVIINEKGRFQEDKPAAQGHPARFEVQGLLTSNLKSPAQCSPGTISLPQAILTTFHYPLEFMFAVCIAPNKYGREGGKMQEGRERGAKGGGEGRRGKRAEEEGRGGKERGAGRPLVILWEGSTRWTTPV